MNLGIQGKNILITGATRGIGRAIAEAFSDEGANIAFCARNKQQVEETQKYLESKKIRAYGDVIDIADKTALKAWINQSANALGGIDTLIANPSAFGIGITEDDWQAGFNIDLMASVRSVEYSLPHLEKSASENKSPSILLVSSAAIAETDVESAYAAYKAGIIHFAKGAARRLAPMGIRVNTVSPGTIYVEDGFWGNAKRHMPEIYQHFYDRNPMSRMGKPEEVANAVVFLSSTAASFITGTNLYVDGAWTSRVNY